MRTHVFYWKIWQLPNCSIARTKVNESLLVHDELVMDDVTIKLRTPSCPFFPVEVFAQSLEEGDYRIMRPEVFRDSGTMWYDQKNSVIYTVASEEAITTLIFNLLLNSR